jgi:hypothetical protein
MAGAKVAARRQLALECSPTEVNRKDEKVTILIFRI